MASGFAGQGGGFGASTINDFGGAVGDVLKGFATADADKLKAQGLRAEATNYGLAADLASQNEQFTEQSTAVTQAALQRNFEKAEGSTETQVAGAGFAASGSALDIMRSNSIQGAVAHQIAGEQGLITEAGYREQQESYTNMQNAANSAAAAEDSMASKATEYGFITGAFKAAAGIATLA